MIRVYLVGSLLVGGAPYLVFAAVALLYLRRRPPPAYRSAAIVAPLPFAAWLAISWLVVELARWALTRGGVIRDRPPPPPSPVEARL